VRRRNQSERETVAVANRPIVINTINDRCNPLYSALGIFLSLECATEPVVAARNNPIRRTDPISTPNLLFQPSRTVRIQSDGIVISYSRSALTFTLATPLCHIDQLLRLLESATPDLVAPANCKVLVAFVVAVAGNLFASPSQ
jgi:hypothetical protein